MDHTFPLIQPFKVHLPVGCRHVSPAWRLHPRPTCHRNPASGIRHRSPVLGSRPPHRVEPPLSPRHSLGNAVHLPHPGSVNHHHHQSTCEVASVNIWGLPHRMKSMCRKTTLSLLLLSCHLHLELWNSDQLVLAAT